MASLAVGDINAPVICVGLLRQKPDTIRGLERRLKRRFALALLTPGSASKSIPRLVKQGLVELVEEGAKPTLHRYRITPAGEAYFLDWLLQPELPPMVRDVLQVKLEFVNFGEMTGYIERIEEWSIAFGAAAAIADEGVQSEERMQSDREKRGQPPDWRKALRIVKTKDAANLGNAMRDRLNLLGAELKEVHATFSAAGWTDE